MKSDLGNQKNLGTIKSSNLCMEIIEYSSPDETAVCNLASLILPTYILNGKYDFNKLHTVTKTITYNLNCMINVYYPIPKAHQLNFHHRPISIRIQGLVDTFMALNYMHCSINLTPIYLVCVLVMLSYQWLLKSTDMGSLYWQHSQMMGLNVTSPDYLNIHTWLDPMSPIYKAELADAIQAGQQKMNILKFALQTTT